MNATRLTVWVVAAVAAIGVTTAAVTVANATGGRDDVLSRDEVSRQLADETAQPPHRSESPPPLGEGEPTALSSQAGQLVARCDGVTLRVAVKLFDDVDYMEREEPGEMVFLESWSPRPGYRVDDVVWGPVNEASVRFVSDSFEDVEVNVRCEAGVPHLAE